jgi:ribonuclease HI
MHGLLGLAEYVALLEAIQCALASKAKGLHVFSDSEVVVRQMRGEYRCGSSRLYSLNWVCRKLTRSFEFSISHIRRENNTAANNLANSAVRKRLSASARNLLRAGTSQQLNKPRSESDDLFSLAL